MSSDIPKASQPRTPPVKPKSAARRARRVERVDFIHICDEYPPIVLEALKKAAPQSSSSSSSSSSDTSGTTQEVPRVSIPRATPGFADTLPFEFPQYPHTATRAWNTPRSYPRQWNRDTMGVDGYDLGVFQAGMQRGHWGYTRIGGVQHRVMLTLIPLLVRRLEVTVHEMYADICCRV